MDRGEQEKTGGDVGGEHDVKKDENIAINVFLHIIMQSIPKVQSCKVTKSHSGHCGSQKGH